jgi:hypothetical protein
MTMQVLAALPQVTVVKKKPAGIVLGPPPKMSLYVLSLAADMTDAAKADPESLQNLGVNINDQNIMQAASLFHLNVSPPFAGIAQGDSLPLYGDGFVLYPPGDPGGALSIYVAVVQSLAKQRQVGSLLTKVFSDSSVQDGVSKITQIWQTIGKISTDAVFGLVTDVGKIMGNVFAQSNDRILFSGLFSGLALDNYSGSQDGTAIPMGNDSIQATLKVWARESS